MLAYKHVIKSVLQIFNKIAENAKKIFNKTVHACNKEYSEIILKKLKDILHFEDVRYKGRQSFNSLNSLKSIHEILCGHEDRSIDLIQQSPFSVNNLLLNDLDFGIENFEEKQIDKNTSENYTKSTKTDSRRCSNANKISLPCFTNKTGYKGHTQNFFQFDSSKSTKVLTNLEKLRNLENKDKNKKFNFIQKKSDLSKVKISSKLLTHNKNNSFDTEVNSFESENSENESYKEIGTPCFDKNTTDHKQFDFTTFRDEFLIKIEKIKTECNQKHKKENKNQNISKITETTKKRLSTHNLTSNCRLTFDNIPSDHKIVRINKIKININLN